MFPLHNQMSKIVSRQDADSVCVFFLNSRIDLIKNVNY